MAWCTWRRPAALLLVGFGVIPPVVAFGQNPPVPPPRTDTVPAVDTLDQTAEYLKALENTRRSVPIFPAMGTEGLLPPGARTVFIRDSLEWLNAETVGDLLATLPEVYLWRGGWIGRGEFPMVAGRAGASAVYYLDGIPYLAVGPDSLAVDPSLFPVSYLDRVEVERVPGQLRVYLFTRQTPTRSARTRVGVSTGSADIARYQGSLETRTRRGVGFSVAADHLEVTRQRGTIGDYQNTNVWLQGSYLPSPRAGVLVQWQHMNPNREPLASISAASDTVDPGLDGDRTDLYARGMWRAREDGIGAGGDLFFGRTSWTGEGGNHGITQAGTVLRYRLPARYLGLTAVWRSDRTPFELHGEAGTMVGGALSAAIEGEYQRHDGGRTSRAVTLRAGWTLPAGLALSGSLRTGRVVATPARAADREQSITDGTVRLAWDRPRVGLGVEVTRTDGLAVPAFRAFRTVEQLARRGATTWLTLRARAAPRQWFTVEGWYTDPSGASPDGVPPRHFVGTATIRSKFLRTFRSGIFDLKLQGGMEAWDRGVAGRLADGTPVILPKAVFFRTLVELQFDQFYFYFDRANLQGTKKGYVPGFPFPSFVNTFGFRWTFFN